MKRGSGLPRPAPNNPCEPVSFLPASLHDAAVLRHAATERELLAPPRVVSMSSPQRLEISNLWSDDVKTKILGSMMLLAALALPMAAQAQGTVRGAQEGARQGERDAGPIGAVVGGALGAAAGTVGGILGVDDRPRFREYVVHERHPSYRYDSDFRIGAELPNEGVTYYDVPAEYHVDGYRYTYVNDHAVLVDPHTHRIVQILD
jgi:hypothetical protein